MKIGLERRDALDARVDAIAVGLFERESPEAALPASLARADRSLGGALAAAWKRREVNGKRKEFTVFHRTDADGRIAFIGLGPRARLTHEDVRRAAAEVVRGLRGRGARTVAVKLGSFVTEWVDAATAARAVVEGSTLGAYQFVRYKTTGDTNVEEVALYLGDDLVREERLLRKEVDAASTLAEAVVWTREIANLPSDTATPERLAEEARALGKEFGLKVTVFDEKALATMHCGGLLAVGGGSSHPPRMIVVEYPGDGRRSKTIAVVGKGITFDSGGISIKPATSMSEMKFDKSGAVATLGILRAAALLKVPPRVVGVLCCAENLPSGSAYRPGDVVRTFNGKTIEVLNTDAEGRVVLADGLGYVVHKYHPDAVIDLATLTGAEVVALGDDTAGLLGNDEALATGLLAASAYTGEPIWRMPLTDYHRELVKSDIADVRNSTELSIGGMLTAAAFLESFVGTVPWAHLDIAGPAHPGIATRKYHPAYNNLGATGFGVRLVTRYLQSLGGSAT
jgi:leucyl aminopeptidase